MDRNHQPLELHKFPYYNQAKGEIEELPALDQRFCQDVHFPLYQAAPKNSPEMDPSLWQRWLEILSVIEKNLIWLLKLPHHKFWCQVVNNDSLQVCLDSYLKQSPRFQTMSWPDEVLEKHNAVHKLVFMSYIRMATYKESSSCFWTPDYFGSLIYDEYIFDIPKILDLCSVYGNKTNCSLLGKAVSNIFKNQPSYNEDLGQTIETIMQILHNLDEKCGVEYQSGEDSDTSARRPHRLSEGPGSSVLLDMSLSEIKDIVLYMSDTLHTLDRFLVDVYPQACVEFYKEKNIVLYLARFYSTTLLKVSNAVRERSVDDLHLRSQLLAHLKSSRKCLLAVARQIAVECLLKPAINAAEAGDRVRTMSLADQYFQLLSDLLGESRFFTDLRRKLPIIEDVQSLLEAAPDIDETRASFILGSLGSGQHERRNRSYPMVNGVDSVPSSNVVNSQELPWNLQEPKGAASSPSVEIDSLISAVHDVLPQLGQGFIESCLLYYGKDSEKTIHALLEGNLPDDLLAMDQTTPRNRPEAVQTNKDDNDEENDLRCEDIPSLNMLQERKNIYDADDFDVYQNSAIDRTRIHIGKKDKTELGAADTQTPEMRQIYERYNLVCDVEEVAEGMETLMLDSATNDMYDDEYDDMYDGLGVDANDTDNADDLLNRRPFVTPRIFQQQRKEKIFEEEESEDEESGKKPDHFIANPADIRAKNEERRRQKQELRNKHRGGGRPPPKEQDGSKVVHDRRRKDENKARIANHNRKRMAAKKTSKGMGPT